MPVVVIGIFFVTNLSVNAQTAGLLVKTNSTDALKPVVTLTNSGTTPCQIATTDLGTITITKFLQEGKVITPVPINAAFDDGLEDLIRKNLKTLKPGEHFEIPLQVYPYNSAHAVQSISWSSETGTNGMIYPFDSKKPYALETRYSVPFLISEGDPLCEVAPATETPGAAITKYSNQIAIGVGLLLFLLIVFFVLRSKKRRKGIATSVLFFAVLSTNILSPPVQAEYTIPESAGPIFDNCLAVLERYPDITGPVLDTLDGARIDIFTNRSGVNYATDWPDGSYRIHWDPYNTYNYYSDDGSVIVSTPCDRLFHEMHHVYEMMNRTNDRHYCSGSGLEINEVNATRAQNRLREAMGLLPRTHYGTERLPAGECIPTPEETSCTGADCGASTGEPHLKTFDGLRYDFQAVGEFILARNTKGDFEVQTRQQPWPDARDVSMNTAVAMKVGTAKVEIQLVDSEVRLLINGKKAPLQDSKLEDGSITVKQTSGWRSINVIRVTWKDGSSVTTNRIGTFALDVIVDPSESNAKIMEGLLGNYNGDSTDDLKPKGSSTSVKPDFEILYPSFADSWRVDNNTSLFTYEKGSNTNTYTDRSFPDKYINPSDLNNRSAAEVICNNFGITDEKILENCIIDIALTNKVEFARSAQMVQGLSGTDFEGSSWLMKVVTPGEVATATFEGKADEKVFLKIINSTIPYQCGGLGIKDPEGNVIGTGCISKEDSFVDTTILPVDGTYTIFIDPVEQNIGQATVQLIKPKNFVSAIKAGSPVKVQLTKPGSIAELHFDGKADQKIFIEFSASTLKQCGGVSLVTPDGNPIAGSACLSNGTESLDKEGILLPSTGRYTIRIEPVDATTGEVTVKVLSQ